MKAGNTLDMLVTEQGRSLRATLFAGRRFDVRNWCHSTRVNSSRDGSISMRAISSWKRLVSLGFFIRPWQTLSYPTTPAIGRFEGSSFDPTCVEGAGAGGCTAPCAA